MRESGERVLQLFRRQWPLVFYQYRMLGWSLETTVFPVDSADWQTAASCAGPMLPGRFISAP